MIPNLLLFPWIFQMIKPPSMGILQAAFRSVSPVFPMKILGKCRESTPGETRVFGSDRSVRHLGEPASGCLDECGSGDDGGRTDPGAGTTLEVEKFTVTYDEGMHVLALFLGIP